MTTGRAGLTPGATIGVLGGGQLGRMMAVVARQMGYRIIVLDPSPRCPTAQVADELGRKPSSVSPARDSLIKKGLIYSSERGLIAFTVPHFGRFLRAQPA